MHSSHARPCSQPRPLRAVARVQVLFEELPDCHDYRCNQPSASCSCSVLHVHSPQLTAGAAPSRATISRTFPALADDGPPWPPHANPNP